jgi:uncharacterized protein (DUF2252 family)
MAAKKTKSGPKTNEAARVATLPDATPEEAGRASTAGPGAKVEHFTPAQRSAMGKEARRNVPLEAHAEWGESDYRVDPIALLHEQAEMRVPELVPIRYGRMMVSPFTFYRGAAYVMASDLASTPRSGFRVQACGDAHLSNFGIFASPERDLMFDMNDFDETLPAPWEWDVKRLATSFVVAGRDRGFDAGMRRAHVLTLVRKYRESMRQFAKMRNLDVWYAKLDVEALLERLRIDDPKMAARSEKRLVKIRAKDNTRAFEKLTVSTSGEPRIVSDPPLIVPLSDLFPEMERQQLFEDLRSIVRQYRRSLPGERRRLLESYRLVDAARKVVGVGSVGTRAHVALMLGRDEADPLFLQFKEAQDSVLAPFAGRSQFKNQGQRVVEGQRLMQATSDILLGWVRVPGLDGVDREYYVRQLWDAKGSVDTATMLPEGYDVYAQMCGWTLARAHARSGDRIAIAAYLGKRDTFDQAIADFSEAYADQNERDYAALLAAVESGRIEATQGV